MTLSMMFVQNFHNFIDNFVGLALANLVSHTGFEMVFQHYFVGFRKGGLHCLGLMNDFRTIGVLFN